jgi:hypothetical protein
MNHSCHEKLKSYIVKGISTACDLIRSYEIWGTRIVAALIDVDINIQGSPNVQFTGSTEVQSVLIN